MNAWCHIAAGALLALAAAPLAAQQGAYASIAGTYSVRQTVVMRITESGGTDTETLTGSDTVTITQNGNAFSYTLRDPNSGQSFVRSGTIDGNTLTLAPGGPVVGFANAPGLVVTQNQFLGGTGTVSQGRIDLTASGRATGTLSGSAFVIEVTATSVFTGTVSPLGPPQISQQPQARTVNVGTSVTLSVVASGSAPLTYQWRKDGVAIPGATGANYVVGAQTSDSGAYSVVVSNPSGSTTSAVATVTVSAPPPNDAFANRIVLSGISVTTTGSTLGATREPGEPIFGETISSSSGASVWYEWTAPASGRVTYSVRGSSFSPGDAVYRGTTLATITRIAGSTAGGSESGSGFNATAGEKYVFVVGVSNGTPGSFTLRLDLATAPVVVSPPRSVVVNPGTTVALTLHTLGASPLGYQWRKNGTPIAGATGALLVLPTVGASDAAGYSVVVTNTLGSATSEAASVTLSTTADTGRLMNLSILTEITVDTPVFTVGTVVGGVGTSGAKPLLVRAVGPSLTPLGVAGALPDPKLDLFGGAALVAANDNWGGAPALGDVFARVGAFAYTAAASRDAAIFGAALPAGGYTVQVGGVGTATGAVIAEIYDATPGEAFSRTTPRLVNVSVLKRIGAGGVLTAGFVIGGATARTVLVRAIGPRLASAPFNLAGSMADPWLQLFSGQTVIAANDNWGGLAALTSAGNAVGAFAVTSTTSRDAMLLVTLPPGAYTAQVSAVDSAAGLAIAEVYEVP